LKHRARPLAVVLIIAAVFAASRAGYWLVDDAPQKADTIVVLAGETDRRPARALQLFDQKYSGRIILDVPADARIFQWSAVELAENYKQGHPQAAAITVCPIYGLSTKLEARDAAKCLEPTGARSVLLVTSDYHTRRALATFQHELPHLTFSVAASRNEAQFGERWWMHRQWAKIFFDEWVKWLWWSAVDRWR
jgi:uncharacterized SAM-binding protein YcdF (DUF218 family)